MSSFLVLTYLNYHPMVFLLEVFIKQTCIVPDQLPLIQQFLNPSTGNRINYGICPKTSYTKVSDKLAYADSADPDQTAEGAV